MYKILVSENKGVFKSEVINPQGERIFVIKKDTEQKAILKAINYMEDIAENEGYSYIVKRIYG